MELERPEDEPLPGDWKRMPEFERLLIFRWALHSRPGSVAPCFMVDEAEDTADLPALQDSAT